jgi:hypothetical protein
MREDWADLLRSQGAAQTADAAVQNVLQQAEAPQAATFVGREFAGELLGERGLEIARGVELLAGSELERAHEILQAV